MFSCYYWSLVTKDWVGLSSVLLQKHVRNSLVDPSNPLPGCCSRYMTLTLYTMHITHQQLHRKYCCYEGHSFFCTLRSFLLSSLLMKTPQRSCTSCVRHFKVLLSNWHHFVMFHDSVTSLCQTFQLWECGHTDRIDSITLTADAGDNKSGYDSETSAYTQIRNSTCLYEFSFAVSFISVQEKRCACCYSKCFIFGTLRWLGVLYAHSGGRNWQTVGICF